MHVLPVLGALERKRQDDPLVVIGVHSAKFDAERDPERIREAMARHGVAHPVIVDEDHALWQRYAVRSWPTLVVIRPDGTIAAVAPGEAELEPLDEFVGGVLAESRADDTLAAAPFGLRSEAPAAPGVLSFPGKVVTRPDGGLFVADTGHHRVLALDADGRVAVVIGSGEPGLRDGRLGEARFDHPQGMAADGELLFVADTGNHVLREVDLARGSVRTVAGTGALGRGLARGTAPARDVALRSPWDLALAGDWVLVAMAGSHQIWAYHRELETLASLAGTGREDIADGAFHEAAFAQPSGLALAGDRLYVADSETSAVRYLDLVAGRVRTVVGTGLFDFGDRDGSREEAQLQHPAGISHGPAGLLVADTYNHKVRRVDPETGAVSTFFAGSDGLPLREPGGLCQHADGRVVVADTNQHRLVELSADGRSARVVELLLPETGGVAAPQDRVETLEPAIVGPGAISLSLELVPPRETELAEGSRVSVRLEASGPLSVPGRDVGFEAGEGRRAASAVLRAGPGAGDAELRIQVTAVGCGKESGACYPVRGAYRLAVRVDAARAHGSIERTIALALGS
jgi:sugar lactone lactonase YvrE